MRFAGPIEPATNRGRSGVSRGELVGRRAREPRACDVDLVDRWLEARSRPARRRCALNELVSMMSAPASRYSRWMPPMTSGRVSTSTSLLPLRSCGCDGEPRRRGSRPRPACAAGSSCPSRRRESGCACASSASSRAVHGSVIRRARFGLAFVPAAISTVNGSPGRARADADVDVVEAGVREQVVQLVVAEAQPAVAELAPAPRLSSCSRRSSTSTRPPGRRIRCASASARSGCSA